MGDDVRAPFERTAEVWGGQRVIDDQRYPGRMRHLGDGGDIDDDSAGVGQAFDEDRLAFRCQGAAEILWVRRIDEMAGPTEFFERQAELGQRAAVQIAGCEEFVPLLQHRREYQELRGMAGCGGDGGASAFQAGNPLFQHRYGRVGQAGVNVAEVVQIE